MASGKRFEIPVHDVNRPLHYRNPDLSMMVQVIREDALLEL
jgi:hypothetical protein